MEYQNFLLYRKGMNRLDEHIPIFIAENEERMGILLRGKGISPDDESLLKFSVSATAGCLKSLFGT